MTTTKGDGFAMIPASGLWHRWFAWRPVKICGRWYWLQYVARDQYANKPNRYNYGRYVSTGTREVRSGIEDDVRDMERMLL